MPQKINQYTKSAISYITWVDRYDKHLHENIIVSLEDERCQTINKIVANELRIVTRSNIFLTPNFLNHFEIPTEYPIKDF